MFIPKRADYNAVSTESNNTAGENHRAQNIFSNLFNRYVGKVYKDHPLGTDNAIISGGDPLDYQGPVGGRLTNRHVTGNQYIQTKPWMYDKDPNAVLVCNNKQKINLNQSHVDKKFSELCK